MIHFTKIVFYQFLCLKNERAAMAKNPTPVALAAAIILRVLLS
jgi:hypothetical protein